ncbi:MBL fold metallo-hydrolase [Aspergillus alliaceus]|uniref:MBL fold metallo-hydrolase n=1 Tax=Petromyces alliaceus TaxID=209559 RepID=UPI0012A52E03|nr:Zn-dependent hydrolases of the beta-lactamase protein [Aspergillus alliaceus]KAB8226984.1 Zn-dependent hydrolases of the beta-lactamase protein [Aspergillus alliaceus]
METVDGSPSTLQWYEESRLKYQQVEVGFWSVPKEYVKFKISPTLNITHIGTATAILELNGFNMLTDPFFSPAGSTWPITDKVALTVEDDLALRLEQLPVIDAVLLSHEDHPDNLDELGRRLLNDRRVFTTLWGKIDTVIAGQKPQIIGTSTQHLPGGEYTGFIVTGEGFGTGRDGLPNAIWFLDDTVYIDELKKMAEEYHICAAVLNLGNAYAPANLEGPNGPLLQITMDGKSAARLIKTDVLVPMHYESWGHFTQFGEELAEGFESESVMDKVCWPKPGEAVSVSPVYNHYA